MPLMMLLETNEPSPKSKKTKLRNVIKRSILWINLKSENKRKISYLNDRVFIMR
jgi:hypothetical protein